MCLVHSGPLVHITAIFGFMLTGLVVQDIKNSAVELKGG
jgi:tRNA A37 threonylcarbamoyladenosine dehydratase